MPIYRNQDDRPRIRNPCVPTNLIQYPLINPEECIKDLDPKGLVDFPSQERYPAPQGEKDGDTTCGCLNTRWPCFREGEATEVLLETIWQPLWCAKDETPSVEQESKLTGGKERLAISRFDVWRMRADDGQIHNAGYGILHWPKRYHVWEIELTYANEKVLDLDGHLTFRIGEKNHLDVPLQGMLSRPTRPKTLVAPLPMPLYLPTEQNFIGIVEFHHMPSDWRYENIGRMRFQLNGYLHREIP